MFVCLLTSVSTPSVILVGVAVRCRVVPKFCKSERDRQTIPENDIVGEVAAVKQTTTPQTGFGAGPEGV